VAVSVRNETVNVKERRSHLDSPRLMAIALVVMHHLAATISGFGSSYYVEPSDGWHFYASFPRHAVLPSL